MLGAQDFFRCFAQDSSDEALWLNGIKAKMNRLSFIRRLHDPKPQDNTEYEISLDQVKMVCAAYARANTKEAAGRKLCLKSLWRAAGRAGEPAMLSYEGFRWNATFDTPTIEGPQSKPSKLKYVFARQTPPHPPTPKDSTHPYFSDSPSGCFAPQVDHLYRRRLRAQRLGHRLRRHAGARSGRHGVQLRRKDLAAARAAGQRRGCD